MEISSCEQVLIMPFALRLVCIFRGKFHEKSKFYEDRRKEEAKETVTEYFFSPSHFILDLRSALH